jgi:hypothetical protein
MIFCLRIHRYAVPPRTLSTTAKVRKAKLRHSLLVAVS